MHYIAEDPTYVAGGLGLIGVALLVAVKVTQQGKYLVWAGVALGLAAVALVVERLWVTDNERIEATVYGLTAAVKARDADAFASYLTPDATVELDNVGPMPNDFYRYVIGFLSRFHRARLSARLLRPYLESLEFDFLSISRLTAHAGALSRRGTAEFRAFASGSHVEPGTGYRYNFATPPSGTDWSLGLREVEPGVWKVERITPTALPTGGEPGDRPRPRPGRLRGRPYRGMSLRSGYSSTTSRWLAAS